VNKRPLFAIMRKDLKVAAHNKGVLLPLIILPLVLFVVIPWVMALVPGMGDSRSSEGQVRQFLATMPASALRQMAGHSPSEQMSIFFLVYAFAPMFLILPTMVSSVLAADSFAGEKERKTVEALLYSPISDRSLFTAKLLGPWLAAVVLGLGSFVLYTIMVDAAGWVSMREILLPNWMWVLLAVWVSPAVAGLGLVVMVFVSARAQGFQDAYQTGGLVVLPIVALMAGQMTGLMFFTVGVVFFLGLALWVLLIALLWWARRGFCREQLMPRG
jgi:ABC-2 type transport system permease protein